MKKLIIKECDECPHRALVKKVEQALFHTKLVENFEEEPIIEVECHANMGRIIKEYPIIPDWCPLEDIKRVKNKYYFGYLLKE